MTIRGCCTNPVILNLVNPAERTGTLLTPILSIVNVLSFSINIAVSSKLNILSAVIFFLQ